jgi:hypothetical protein
MRLNTRGGEWTIEEGEENGAMKSLKPSASVLRTFN